MRNLDPNSVRGCIQRALTAAKMINANFECPRESDEAPLPKTEEEVTPFILKRTELYRGSWIIKPLEAALAKLEKKIRKK